MRRVGEALQVVEIQNWNRMFVLFCFKKIILDILECV